MRPEFGSSQCIQSHVAQASASLQSASRSELLPQLQPACAGCRRKRDRGPGEIWGVLSSHTGRGMKLLEKGYNQPTVFCFVVLRPELGAPNVAACSHGQWFVKHDLAPEARKEFLEAVENS